MPIALVLVLVAVGSVLFHLLSPWWWTPIASNWQYIDNTITITFWITGFVFSCIILFMAYCTTAFVTSREGGPPYEPENKKLEWWLAIATAVGVAAMLAPGLFVWNQFVKAPADASEVEVVGQQWQWSFCRARRSASRCSRPCGAGYPAHRGAGRRPRRASDPAGGGGGRASGNPGRL